VQISLGYKFFELSRRNLLLIKRFRRQLKCYRRRTTVELRL